MQIETQRKTYCGKGAEIMRQVANIKIKTKTIAFLLALALLACVFALSACQSKLSKIQAEYKGGELELGGKISSDDLTVTAVYADGKSKTVTDYKLDCDTSVYGQRQAKVSYTEGGLTRHATFYVTVKQPQVDPTPVLSAISAEYAGGELFVGERIDKSKVTVTAAYSDGEGNAMPEHQKTVTDFALSYDFSSAGEKTVTVTYGELGVTVKTTFTVTVKQQVAPPPEKELASVSAEYAGDEIEFGGLLSLEDVLVTATYSDGSDKTVKNFSVEGFNPQTAGEQQVTVIYTENGVTRQCQITVTVKERQTEVANYGKYGILQDDGSVKITNTAIVNGDLQIHFLAFENVTSGDCVYIKAGETDVLIDAGSTATSSAVIDKYVSKFCKDKKFEYAIATHAHSDHISAYVGTYSNDGTDKKNGIFDLYGIDTLIKYAKTAGSSTLTQRFDVKVNALSQNGTNVYTALDCYNNANGASRVYKLSDSVEMEVLYNYYYDHSTSEENLNSVCVLLHQYGDGYNFENKNDPDNEKYVNHYLFTGDLEKEGEAALVRYNKLPNVLLYKGGHHGSATASSEVLLQAIQPKLVCVCTCCDDVNPYKFPRQEFLNRVAVYTDMLFLTNTRDGASTSFVHLNGNICVKSDKNGVFVNCSNNNTIFKYTAWFKANRTCPKEWEEQSGEPTA